MKPEFYYKNVKGDDVYYMSVHPYPIRNGLTVTFDCSFLGLVSITTGGVCGDEDGLQKITEDEFFNALMKADHSIRQRWEKQLGPNKKFNEFFGDPKKEIDNIL